MDVVISRHDCDKHAGWPVDGLDCPFCHLDQLTYLKEAIPLLIADWEDGYKEMHECGSPDGASSYRICIDGLKALLEGDNKEPLVPCNVKDLMRMYEVTKEDRE